MKRFPSMQEPCNAPPVDTLRGLIAPLQIRLLLLLSMVLPLIGFLASDLALGIAAQRLCWDGLMGLVRGLALFVALVLGLFGSRGSQPGMRPSPVGGSSCKEVRDLGACMGLLALMLALFLTVGCFVCLLLPSQPMLPWRYWGVLVAQGWIWFLVGSFGLCAAKAWTTLTGSLIAGQCITYAFLTLAVIKPRWSMAMEMGLNVPRRVVTLLKSIVPDGHRWDLWTPGTDPGLRSVLSQTVGSTVALLLLICMAGCMLWIVSELRGPNSSLSEN